MLFKCSIILQDKLMGTLVFSKHSHESLGCGTELSRAGVTVLTEPVYGLSGFQLGTTCAWKTWKFKKQFIQNLWVHSWGQRRALLLDMVKTRQRKVFAEKCLAATQLGRETVFQQNSNMCHMLLFPPCSNSHTISISLFFFVNTHVIHVIPLHHLYVSHACFLQSILRLLKGIVTCASPVSHTVPDTLKINSKNRPGYQQHVYRG